MDHAVALVQTYLQLNGYFTATEYPVVELGDDGMYRSLTDVDVMAIRYPATGLVDFGRGQIMERRNEKPDPLLAPSDDQLDLIIGEVKEGKANINLPALEPTVLRSVLARFGCLSNIDGVVEDILKNGSAQTPDGHRVRVILFGGNPRQAPPFPCKVISLGHILRFLQAYVASHWEMIRHVQWKDPAFGFLITLEKAKRGERRTKVTPRGSTSERRSDPEPITPLRRKADRKKSAARRPPGPAAPPRTGGR